MKVNKRWRHLKLWRTVDWLLPEVDLLSFISEMADVEGKLLHYKKYLERYFEDKSREYDVGIIFNWICILSLIGFITSTYWNLALQLPLLFGDVILIAEILRRLSR